jgi:hypothetical protein
MKDSLYAPLKFQMMGSSNYGGGNNRFKEAVLAEAMREQKEQLMIDRNQKEEERLQKGKLSKVIQHNANMTEK